MHLKGPSAAVAGQVACHLLVIEDKALFSLPQKPKKIQDSPSHQIFQHMHKALNIDENKN